MIESNSRLLVCGLIALIAPLCGWTPPLVAWQDGSAPRLTAESLFVDDRVIPIEIEMPAEDWDTIRRQTRSFVESLGRVKPESPFEYVPGNIRIDGQLIENVGIRKKGFLGSLDENRPSLKIRFDKYTDQAPIEGLDRLTLNNNKQDPSRLMQFLTFRQFNRAESPAPRCGFARVSVNGEDLGIYSNVESVRDDFLKHQFGDDSGDLFEGTVVDFYPEWVRNFEQKNKRARYDRLEELTDILQEEELDTSRLESVLDVDAFIRFWATESLTGFWDGYCNNQNNFFVYVRPSDRKIVFFPWGADSALTSRMPLPPYRIRPRSVHCQSILANRLYRIPEYRQKYQETLMGMLDELWNEQDIVDEIERLDAMLVENGASDSRSRKRAVGNMKRFVQSRRDHIMEEFADGPPELPTRERTVFWFAEIGTATVEFETRWYDSTPRQTAGLGTAKLQLEMGGQPVELDDVGVYAETSKWPSPGGNPPPSIVVVGRRTSDDTPLVLGTGLSEGPFQPSPEPIGLGGIYIEDGAFVNESGQMRMINGTVRLDEASMNDGDTVSGTMKLTIVEMQGGKPVDEDRP